MRTKPAHIEPGCPYCNHDHDPAIECRYMPASVRFQIAGSATPTRRAESVRITDASGRLIAVKHVYREEP